MAKKITNKTTDLTIGSVLKVINIKENTPYVLNKFYNITDGDGVGALFVGGYSDIEFTIHDLGNYFDHIASLEDIEDLESKALLLKQIFNQFKELSEAEEQIDTQALINETIAFLAQDEIYKCDEVELRFICNNIDITMIEKCSCCGKVLFPDDECYADDLNDGAALCDHCSIFDEETDMYIKTVRQDVVEKLTGYKFSPHVGNVGSALEDFNHYLKNNELKFGVNEPESKKHFKNFVIDNTELNFCDCCGLIEKSDDLAWVTEREFFEDEKVAIDFINTTYSNFEAICDNCLSKFIARTKLSLHDIVQRIKYNRMVYRVGELVILKKVDQNANNMFGYIESLDESNQTYKLIGFDEIFKEEDLFDIANEAYTIEYNEFIKSKHIATIDDLSDFATDYKEYTLDMLVENFGHKEEFIEHLKTNNLPYGRLLTPKFKIGDKFNIHFNHYEDNEVTTHTISRIDTSFTEANEIVYWSDEFVYITESELEKQKVLRNEEFDEVLIVKNDILHNIFCVDENNDIVVPTFNELEAADKYQPNWQLTEDYQNYSLPSIIQIVNELTENFFTTLEVLNAHKEKNLKSKKYGLRTYAEFGSPIEIVEKLQELHRLYDNQENKMICLQANISTQDFSTIEIVLQCNINFEELKKYLSELEDELSEEIEMLIEAIKQAQADNHTTLHIYDC